MGTNKISIYIIYFNFDEKNMGTWEQDWLWEKGGEKTVPAIFEWGTGEHGNKIVATKESQLNMNQQQGIFYFFSFLKIKFNSVEKKHGNVGTRLTPYQPVYYK